MKTKLIATIAGLLLTAAAVSSLAADNPPVMVVRPGPLPANPFDSDQKFFRSVAFANGKTPKESTWLGVGVEESSEPLAAQLDLKPGQGLVVNFVSSNSPAATAGLRKNDVLTELDGQMLVDPTQLQKLVQMHADGESIKIEFYRSGKKQSATARLTKHTPEQASFNYKSSPDLYAKAQLEYNNLLTEFDREKFDVQMQQAVQQAQKAVQSALQQSLNGTDGLNRKLETLHKNLGNLADGGMKLTKSSTVVVKNDGESVRTMVKKDNTGTYVIVADPAKRLTAHDSDGKLTFDGAIESLEQQEKVPREIWQKVEPMLGQMDHNSAGHNDSKVGNDSESK